MTLTSALRIATGSLAGNSQQISTLSKNIAGIGNPNYIRRESVVTSGIGGSQQIATTRYINQSVFRASLSSSSRAELQRVISNGIEQLSILQDVDGFSSSPTALIGDLEEALQLASSAPGDPSALTSLVETARTVAMSINSAYEQIMQLRQSADASANQSVININSLLSQIKTVNNEVVTGSKVGNEALDSLDTRDELLRRLSDEIGISVNYRENNDIVILTENGLMLFETQPRNVEFVAQPIYGPATVGNPLRIDGVVASGATSPMPITSGQIAGYLELRDDILLEQQHQLDEIARGLIELFSEYDRTAGGSKPALAGLFTWSGGPGLPASATLEPGIAQSLMVNPLAEIGRAHV